MNVSEIRELILKAKREGDVDLAARLEAQLSEAADKAKPERATRKK